MKKFKVEVQRTDQYIVEIDENKINEEWMEEYRKYFTDIYTLEEHAENIALQFSKSDSLFIEGYGFVKLDDKKYNDEIIDSGINIRIVSQDGEFETEVFEIK